MIHIFSFCISSSIIARFTAGSNQLSGGLPEALTTMPNLQVLWLFKNGLEGPMLENWSSDISPSLIVLDVYQNRLTGEIPPQISELDNLQQLVLGNNRFQGGIRDAVGNRMPQLTVLNVEQCSLSGNIPTTLANLGNLTSLRLGNNMAFGAGSELPDFIFDFENLVELRLPGLGLTGDLASKDWANLPLLRMIDLSDNDFDGGFPSAIVALEDLQELVLSNNFNLGGILPDDIDELVNLRQLRVASAGMMGNLTESIGNLPRLGM
jgi:Leucine-rich repeat (LRR) protein